MMSCFRPECVPFLLARLLRYILAGTWMLNDSIVTCANYRETYPLKTHCLI